VLHDFVKLEVAALSHIEISSWSLVYFVISSCFLEVSLAKQKHKTVLFLCTGNYYRSRFAEIYFNAVAAKMGLPWRATSRGLALERGLHNVGPIAKLTLDALTTLNVRDREACERMPMPATDADFASADYVVALKQMEHHPLLIERHPAFVEKVEFWHVEDEPGVLGLIEREVTGLAARLITGAKRQEPEPEPVAKADAVKPAKKVGDVVRVGRETKGRRGKGVTTVSDVPLAEAELQELAATLKQKCGTGGTVKDGVIEIQGDQRDRLTAVLEELGYRVKRSGG
jgi:protein-tyrosine phosphatase